jgi:phosphopantetheine--protein transferase-like protein
VIISIGIDIIEVRRVREVIERTPRFVERVYTQAERAYCESRGAVAAQHYAARFAAKEAALKALQIRRSPASFPRTRPPTLRTIRSVRRTPLHLSHHRTRHRAGCFRASRIK